MKMEVRLQAERTPSLLDENAPAFYNVGPFSRKKNNPALLWFSALSENALQRLIKTPQGPTTIKHAVDLISSTRQPPRKVYRRE